MMKKTTRTLFLILSSFALLIYAALNVSAQERPKPSPRDRIIITPNDRIRLPRALSIIPPNTITGRIRWKKEYGLPYNNIGGSPSAIPYPCSSRVFFLRSRILVVNDRPGQTPKGSWQDVGNVTGEPSLSDAGTGTPRQEGDYYVCRYAIVNLPLDRNILLELDINPSYLPPDYLGFDRSVRLTTPWVGGTQPQPPSGYQRTIKENRSITLTTGAPRANVDFEIIYAPISSPR